jgi:hypothetical protein
MVSLSTVHAGWKEIGSNYHGIFYVDEATLAVQGKVRRFLLLDDMRKPNLQGDHSIVSQNEVDCGSGKFRSVKTTYLFQAMGRGTPHTLEPEQNAGALATPKVVWLDPTVGQPSEQIVKWACKTK